MNGIETIYDKQIRYINYIDKLADSAIFKLKQIEINLNNSINKIQSDYGPSPIANSSFAYYYNNQPLNQFDDHATLLSKLEYKIDYVNKYCSILNSHCVSASRFISDVRLSELIFNIGEALKEIPGIHNDHYTKEDVNFGYYGLNQHEEHISERIGKLSANISSAERRINNFKHKVSIESEYCAFYKDIYSLEIIENLGYNLQIPYYFSKAIEEHSVRDSKLLKFALDHGFNPNYRLKNGNTLLEEAIDTNDVIACKLLLDHRASITPNLAEKSIYDQALLQLSLENGLNPNHRLKNGNTLLEEAINNDNYQICKLLVDHRASITHKIAERSINDNKILKFALEHGLNSNYTLENGNTLLEQAVYNNNTIACKLLTDYHANITWKSYYSPSIMHIAAKNGNVEIMELLLQNGGKQYIDNVQLTWPGYASWFFHGLVSIITKPFKWVVGSADDVYGTTPLHTATINGHGVMVALLKYYGANTSIKDESGCTYDAYLDHIPSAPSAFDIGLSGESFSYNSIDS
jgi:ankyrin repeat protein